MIQADRTIVELMEIPEVEHGLDWLKASLQAAIKLEFFTLPPYLSALWSIKSDETDPAAISIRNHIATEEMLHMGLACNLLTAIGGTPKINTPEAVPRYPGPLPGIDADKDLIVSLQALSPKAIEVFLKIEFPEGGPVAVAPLASLSTIGAFYSAIENAFNSIQPTLSQDRQLDGFLGLVKITSLSEVRQAIQLIKRQGEGSKTSPEDTGPDDLAHYYRFAEIFHGKKLRKDKSTGEWHFDGSSIPFPDVWPMAEVPSGGYQREDVSDQVLQMLEQVDQSFTKMTSELQSAWENGDQNQLSYAVSTMFELKAPSKSLMQTPIPSGNGNYGPCFRLVKKPLQ